MQNSVAFSAPCKINLHLAVTGKRADGFHMIESLFQTISLADSLRVSLVPLPGACEVLCSAMDLPARNTLTQAVEVFRQKTGITDGFRVELDKRVPSGAGLGGGSSDGAAMLKAVNELCKTGLSDNELEVLAGEIGSDVPFFIRSGAAIVTGRGETVSPIMARTDLSGVWIWPGVHSPTSEAYRLVDTWHDAGKRDPSSLLSVDSLERIYQSRLSQWSFANSFTEPVSGAFPVIGEALADVRESGAAYCEMSGSGSAVYGLFTDPDKARFAAAKIAKKWRFCGYFLLLAQ